MPPPDDQHATDRELVAATLSGDQGALTRLHQRYFGRVYRCALLYCRAEADAEDLAGETFLRAITYLPGFKFRGESLLPWLLRICANLCVDQKRRSAALGGACLSLDAATADGVRRLVDGLAATDENSPHRLAARREVQEIVRGAIANLPPDQARAVTLRFLGDLPLREIAREMERSEGAIKSLLHRALVGLRQSLQNETRAAEALSLVRERAESAAAAAAQSVTQHEEPWNRI